MGDAARGALAALLLAVLFGRPATAETCAAAEHPIVTVEIAPARVQRDDALSLAELRRRLDEGNGVAGAGHRIVYGLTEGSRNIRINVASGMRTMGSGRYCVWPRRVRIVIAPELRVHVAEEAAENGCFRDFVLEHEMRHVAVEQRFAAGEPSYVESRVQALLGRVPARVFGAASGQSAWLDEIVRAVLAEVKAASEATLPDRRAAHRAEVDEPQRNTAATKVCDGFAQGLVDRQLAALRAEGAPAR